MPAPCWSTVPDPAELVAEMVLLARPGGWVASMEPDTEYWMCYPPQPTFTRACEIFPVVFGRNRADPQIGRRVPELFRRAGLADVGTEARVQMYPPGNSRRMIRLDLVRSMRTQVLCWRWDWPAKQNCMNWTPLPAPTSMTALRSWCPAFSS